MTLKIVLGAAQFGLSYGVANNNGQVTTQELKKIIQLAKQANISKLDTAIVYGNSEKALGNIGISDWNIITKIPEAPTEVRDIKSWVYSETQNSLNRLNTSRLYAVMLHTTSILSSDNAKEYWDALQELKQQGVVQKIGYSIYNPGELDEYYSKYYPDIIQAPYNILDNRLKKSGWLQKLSDDAVEVHVRSVFLQGLLLMNKNQRPSYFKRWSELWQKWHSWLSLRNITALEATLWFVLQEDLIDNVVVGVDSADHLQDILDALGEYHNITVTDFLSEDLNLIDPSHWKF
jgi:aryl-alcohol dehydrogenase-like predicted oxidoreductase